MFFFLLSFHYSKFEKPRPNYIEKIKYICILYSIYKLIDADGHLYMYKVSFFRSHFFLSMSIKNEYTIFIYHSEKCGRFCGCTFFPSIRSDCLYVLFIYTFRASAHAKIHYFGLFNASNFDFVSSS